MYLFSVVLVIDFAWPQHLQKSWMTKGARTHLNLTVVFRPSSVHAEGLAL